MTSQPEYAEYWEDAFIAGLKTERNAQGMSQTDLAERMSALGYKFHQATVYKIENGDRKVSASEAWGLAEVLDVPVEHLFDYKAAHATPAARKKLIRTQADNFLQLVIKLDDDARRLRTAHKAFVETVVRAEADGLLERRTVNDPEVSINKYYSPLLDTEIHNELLERLRGEVWTGEFAEIAGSISGIAGLGDVDWYEDN